MRTVLAHGALIFLAVVFFASGPAYSVEHSLKIMRHTSTPLSNSQADGVLHGATAVMKDGTNNSNDVRCNVTFKRFGSVVPSNSVPVQMISLSHWRQLPTRAVTVLRRIRYCAGQTNTDISGCAGGVRMAVVSRPAFDHIVWAHEFGHTAGLRHASAGGDRTNLMYSVARTQSRRLTRPQCIAFATRSRLPVRTNDFIANLLEEDAEDDTEFVVPVPSGDEEVAEVELDRSEPTVDEFIASYRAHNGFPYNLAARLFSNKDIPDLVAALNDENRSDSWVYAVSTLGAIGTPEARKALLDFLRKTPNADLTEAQYYAKTDVPIALAWVANKSSDKTALAGLLGCTTEDWWMAQGAGDWATTYNKQKIAGQALIKDLIASCIISLPLTASDEAAVRLGVLRAWTERAEQAKLQTNETADAAQSLEKEAADQAKELLELYLDKHAERAQEFPGDQSTLEEMLSAAPESTISAVDALGGTALIDDQLDETARFKEEKGGVLTRYYESDEL